MNRFIKINKKNSDMDEQHKKEIESVIRQFPLPLQPKVIKAFQLAGEGDHENASALCREILDIDAEKPELRYLLAICYFSQDNMYDAMMILKELTSEYPEEEYYHCLLGMTHHGMENYRDAVKEFHSIYPPKTYHPFYFTSYGDSLEKIGHQKESRDIFYHEIEQYKKTGEILSAEMLDGAFQHLLYLDVILGNRKYQEDMDVYLKFLNEIEMTEKMQEHLRGTIVLLSTLMNNKWYRPLFWDLAVYIDKKGFFTTEKTKKTLESAFLSWESYAYHDDEKISKIMETFLNTIYNVKYTITEDSSEIEKTNILTDNLIYTWYMCQYLPERREEIAYIKETYPHIYTCCQNEIDEIIGNPEGTADKALTQIHDINDTYTVEEYKEILQDDYAELTAMNDLRKYISFQDIPYRRNQVKIGRNDPCPCGSGKKYKKCCGKFNNG